jgi:hypothetical protein
MSKFVPSLPDMVKVIIVIIAFNFLKGFLPANVRQITG